MQAERKSEEIIVLELTRAELVTLGRALDLAVGTDIKHLAIWKKKVELYPGDPFFSRTVEEFEETISETESLADEVAEVLCGWCEGGRSEKLFPANWFPDGGG